jgi:hypothetical protein
LWVAGFRQRVFRVVSARHFGMRLRRGGAICPVCLKAEFEIKDVAAVVHA